MGALANSHVELRGVHALLQSSPVHLSAVAKVLTHSTVLQVANTKVMARMIMVSITITYNRAISMFFTF